MSTSSRVLFPTHAIASLWNVLPEIGAHAQAQAKSRGYGVIPKALWNVIQRTEFQSTAVDSSFESAKRRVSQCQAGWKNFGIEVRNDTNQFKERAVLGAQRSDSVKIAMASAYSSGGANASEKSDGKITFRVTEGLKLILQKGDITVWHINGQTDAIVNAANERMLGGGGVDGAIHRKAGRQLVEACSKFPQVRPNVRCPTGEARLTSGYRLPAKYVIHTVGPIYAYHPEDNERLLSMAYRNSLDAAVVAGVQYIAFPAISCGVYGYPMGEAAQVSLQTIRKAPTGVKEVHFVLYNEEAYSEYCNAAESLFARE